jgi:hypothetical protein
MSISKLNAEQFSAIGKNFKGVVLEYAGKEGKNTAILFFGADYEATGKTQDEVLRVVKNVMLAHWETKNKETVLRESNDGIRTKLRASTPLKIHIHTDKGETVKVYNLEDSVWARVGLMPTKKDLERSAREQKKYVHGAAVAMLEALKFRLELPKMEETPLENEGVNTAPMPVAGNTPDKNAETVAPKGNRNAAGQPAGMRKAA